MDKSFSSAVKMLDECFSLPSELAVHGHGRRLERRECGRRRRRRKKKRRKKKRRRRDACRSEDGQRFA